MIVRRGPVTIDYGPTPAPPTQTSYGGSLARPVSEIVKHRAEQARWREKNRARRAPKPEGPRVISAETRAKMSASAIARWAVAKAERDAA